MAFFGWNHSAVKGFSEGTLQASATKVPQQYTDPALLANSFSTCGAQKASTIEPLDVTHIPPKLTKAITELSVGTGQA